jgi:hypothetical protein
MADPTESRESHGALAPLRTMTAHTWMNTAKRMFNTTVITADGILRPPNHDFGSLCVCSPSAACWQQAQRLLAELLASASERWPVRLPVCLPACLWLKDKEWQGQLASRCTSGTGTRQF